MLMGAEQGHWNRRRDLKRNGDAAMSQGEYARAVDCYIDARKAVPVAEAYDSPVLQLTAALRDAKQKAADEAGKSAPSTVNQQGASGSSYGGGGAAVGTRAELAPGGLRARAQADSHEAAQQQRGGYVGGSQSIEHGSSFMSDSYSVHSSAGPPQYGAGAGAAQNASSNAAVSNAVREAENRHKSGDVQGTLSAIEDAIAYGFQSAEALSVKLLMRKVSTQLVDEAHTAKSEAQAAKDYAKGRDAEVYDLAVGKKRIEDESISERQKLADEMMRAKRETDSLADTLQRANQEKLKADQDLEQMRSMVENQRSGWEAEKRSLEYDKNSSEAGTKKLNSQLQEVQAQCEEQKAELEKLTEKLRCSDRDKLVREKEAKDLAVEVEKVQQKASDLSQAKSDATAEVEEARKAAALKLEELEAEIRRLGQEVTAAQQHAEAEATRADQGWEKAKQAASKVDEQVSRARDAENQMALMERELDQIAPRVEAAEQRAARAEARIDKEMERADKESTRAEKAREALLQQQNESQNDAQRLKELAAVHEQLERLQSELAITKEDLKQSEANAIINLKEAQEVAVHHSRQFEEAGQLLALLDLDLNDINTDRIDALKAAEKQVPSLERELAENIEAWKKEIQEKDAVLQEFAETSAVEISNRDVELERQMADHAKQMAELRSELDEANTAAEEHVQANESKQSELQQLQDEAKLQLDSANEAWQAQVDELNLTIDRMQDRNQSLLDDSKTMAAQSETTLEKHKEAQRAQVEKMTAAIATKDSEVKSLKKKVKTLAKSMQEQTRESEAQAAKSTKHLSDVKQKFEEEHKKWVQALTDERAKFQNLLSSNREKVAQEMTAKLNAERDSRANEADQIRQEHAKLAASLSRKMEEAVGDARSTMEAASRSTSAAPSPQRRPTRAPASVASSPGDGDVSITEEQTSRLHMVWQDKMDQQKEHWETELEVSQKQRQQLMERIASSSEELKEVQSQLLLARQQVVEEGRSAEQSKVATRDATDKVSQLQLEVDALRQAATQAEDLYNQQLADQGTTLRAQISASVAQIKSLKIEIDQMAASLDEAQAEVLAAREDQFAAKLKVQDLERQLKDTSGLVAVQADLERAQSEVITLTRELTSMKSMAEEARMEQKAAVSAVTQRDAKIAALIQAAEESDSLREQLREEQASQQATQQAKQLAAKTQQIEALKEAAAVSQQALDTVQQEQDRLKSEQVANARRYQALESTIAQRQLREEQLQELVVQREAALEEKTEELATLVASTEDETAGAQATAEIMEAELAAAIEARDNALHTVATSEQVSAAELVKTEEKIVELEARLQAEREAIEAEIARADAAEAEKRQLDLLMQTIVRRFETQAAEAIELTETFTPASPARFGSGDPAAKEETEWTPSVLQDMGQAFDDLPAGADAATLNLPSMPELPATPPSKTRRRESFVSVSTVDSAGDDRLDTADLEMQQQARTADESAADPTPAREVPSSPASRDPAAQEMADESGAMGSTPDVAQDDAAMISPSSSSELRDTFEDQGQEPQQLANQQALSTPDKRRVPSAVEAFVAAEAEASFSSSPNGEYAASESTARSAASVISEVPSQPTTSRSHEAISAPVSAPMTPHVSPPAVPPIDLAAVASTEPQRMPKRYAEPNPTGFVSSSGSLPVQSRFRSCGECFSPAH
jgi:outer membrane murein-binding lipoprotein Lpp